MKNQLKNLLVRFYSSDGKKTINGKHNPKSESDERIQNNWVGGKHNSNGQLSRIKTNV